MRSNLQRVGPPSASAKTKARRLPISPAATTLARRRFPDWQPDTKAMPTLKGRFPQFMLSTEGVESVDDLLKHCVLEGRKRADYLACDRRVVIEQKSIDVNPDYKI
jgi:hypothetical protein